MSVEPFAIIINSQELSSRLGPTRKEIFFYWFCLQLLLDAVNSELCIIRL